MLLCLRVQGNGSRWLQFECLRGVDFVLGDVCKRKPCREGEERLSDREFQFSRKFQFRTERKEGIVLRKFLTCRFVKTTTFGDHFPPQKPNTTPFWGPLSSQRPNTTPFYINFPTKFRTLDRPILYLFFGFFFFVSVG